MGYTGILVGGRGRELMVAAGCWLGLVRLLSVSDNCRLLEDAGSGAGGTNGVHAGWEKGGAGGG